MNKILETANYKQSLNVIVLIFQNREPSHNSEIAGLVFGAGLPAAALPFRHVCLVLVYTQRDLFLKFLSCSGKKEQAVVKSMLHAFRCFTSNQTIHRKHTEGQKNHFLGAS